MAHESLYRKARPRTFDEVVGQSLHVQTIAKAIVDDRLATSILLSGHYGCGKTTLARLIAASVNCDYREEGSANPCGGSHPDCMTCPGVLEGTTNIGAVFEMDAASKGSIGEVRALIDSMDYQVSARHKVYIIDEAHRLSKDAVSALLKTLEEPPPGVVIVMATTEPNKIDRVIRSRLTHYGLSSLDDEELTTLLRNAAEKYGLEISDSDVTAILARANNSGRDALNYLERWVQQDHTGEDLSPLNFLNGMTDAIADADSAAVITLLNERLSAGEDAATALRTLTDHFRNALVALQAPTTLTAAADWRAAAEYAAERLSLRTILALVQSLLSANRPNSPDARIALEWSLLEMVMRKGKPGGAAGGAAPITDKDIEAIADAVAQRYKGQVEREVARALEGFTPASVAEPSARVAKSTTIESSLDEAAEEISKPLPPAPWDDEGSSSSRAPFNADSFMKSLKAGMSRRGGVLLDRYGSVRTHSKKDDTIVLVTTDDKSLRDEDWDEAVRIVKGLGWELEESVKS